MSARLGILDRGVTLRDRGIPHLARKRDATQPDKDPTPIGRDRSNTLRNRGATPTARETGVTLIELVAVLAIFAMVALMGLQSLDGALRARTRLTGLAEDSAALERAVVLLRADLRAAVPLDFAPPNGAPEPALLTRPEAGLLALSVHTPGDLPGEQTAGLSRVVWRFDRTSGALTRQAWPVLAPRDDRARGPEVAMLAGIEGFDVSVLPEQGGAWTTVYGQDPGLPAPPLPRAIELRLALAAHGPLRLLVAY